LDIYEIIFIYCAPYFAIHLSYRMGTAFTELGQRSIMDINRSFLECVWEEPL